MAPTRGAAAVPCILPRDGRVFVRGGVSPFRPHRSPRGRHLAVLARAFGRSKGEEFYSAGDVDVDGLVDGTDLALLAARFGDSL